MTSAFGAVRAYAEHVTTGQLSAGPHVRAWCDRVLDELDNPPDGYVFNRDAAQRGVDWFQRGLRLGADAFELFDWQQFLTALIDGWQRRDNGMRRFRIVYCETGKGSGKTPWAAGLSLGKVIADGEHRAEGYVCARTSEQALVTYRDIVALVEDSPGLGEACRVLGGDNPYNVVYHRTRSFIRRIAAQERGEGRSGYRPHAVVIDEYHEHATSAMLDQMRAGVKARKQPLIIITTNSGTSKTSACGIEHDYAIRVAHGEVIDPQYLPYVCAMDEGDDEEDRANWIKTNPSLPALPGYDYIEGMVAMSRGMPSKRAVVDRLTFCKWTEAAEPWIDEAAVKRAEVDDIDRSGKCVAALDLAATTDLASGVLLWENEDGYSAEATIWTPDDTLDARAEDDQAPYRQWSNEGHLVATPGTVLSFDHVAKWLASAHRNLGLADVAFDAWRIAYLKRELDRVDFGDDEKPTFSDLENAPDKIARRALGGIRLTPHPQGFAQRGKTGLQMSASIDTCERLLHHNQLRIKRNPVVRSAMLGAMVAHDQSLNRRFLKIKSTTRIDAAVALVMAVGIATTPNPDIQP